MATIEAMDASMIGTSSVLVQEVLTVLLHSMIE